MLDLAALERILAATPGLRFAVLFGSAARGTGHGGSDVDTGVSLENGTILPSALEVALERALGWPVDLLCVDTAPPLLRFEIARDGQVLVERELHSWSEFRAHAMIDWWDWAPTARMMHSVRTARLARDVAHGSS